MKVIYDETADIVCILLSDAPVYESDEEKSGIILDYDAAGQITGLEILDASERIADPHSIEYVTAA